MKKSRLLLGLFASVALSGCDVSGLAINGQGAGSQIEAEAVEISRDALTSNLALMNKESAIRIGQKLNTALVGSFRKPAKGVSLKELPPGLSADFAGLGWETPERTVSLVAKEDDIVLALDMNNQVNLDFRDELVSRYRFVYGDPAAQVSSEKAEYWFWEDRDLRVMVCSVLVEKGEYRVTSVLGLVDVMSRLRMDVDSARKDVAAADQISAEIEKN